MNFNPRHILPLFRLQFGFLMCNIFLPLKRETLWVDKIQFWCSYVPEKKYCFFGKNFILKDRKKFFYILWKMLINDYNINGIINELEKNFSFKKIKINNDYYNLRFSRLSNKEINEMKEYGHIIAAHSYKHDMVKKLSLAELKKDIKLCEQQIGKSSWHFSGSFWR